jgi:hypothetical protein
MSTILAYSACAMMMRGRNCAGLFCRPGRHVSTIASKSPQQSKALLMNVILPPPPNRPTAGFNGGNGTVAASGRRY